MGDLRLMDDERRPAGLFDPLSWFREFLSLIHRRIRTQGRLMGSAVLVGIVAGLGAVVFSVACHFVS